MISHPIRFSVDMIHGMIKNKKKKFKITRDITVPLKLKSLETFTYKGCDCVGCCAKAAYYELTFSNNQWFLALWAIPDPKFSSSKTRVRMTSDHIQAKSKGGDNGLINRQPMCSTCNSIKADYASLEEGIEQRRLAKEAKEIKEYSSSGIYFAKIVAKLEDQIPYVADKVIAFERINGKLTKAKEALLRMMPISY